MLMEIRVKMSVLGGRGAKKNQVVSFKSNGLAEAIPRSEHEAMQLWGESHPKS